eukprot:CAMPEP_0119226054 /NCGR_PEP_ID=MMETSP1327-20130426/34475_1 /TAXON_ID=38833 /ORGANISM="Micromonas pusilla, Strain RCC2306" /LENGTH=164 /DNA_ID=CAMNT_0007224335 /DNA_START=524 /DNA_END=1018 /DNA_ORIENTATION=-
MSRKRRCRPKLVSTALYVVVFRRTPSVGMRSKTFCASRYLAAETAADSNALYTPVSTGVPASRNVSNAQFAFSHCPPFPYALIRLVTTRTFGSWLGNAARISANVRSAKRHSCALAKAATTSWYVRASGVTPGVCLSSRISNSSRRASTCAGGRERLHALSAAL